MGCVTEASHLERLKTPLELGHEDLFRAVQSLMNVTCIAAKSQSHQMHRIATISMFDDNSAMSLPIESATCLMSNT